MPIRLEHLRYHLKQRLDISQHLHAVKMLNKARLRVPLIRFNIFLYTYLCSCSILFLCRLLLRQFRHHPQIELASTYSVHTRGSTASNHSVRLQKILELVFLAQMFLVLASYFCNSFEGSRKMMQRAVTCTTALSSSSLFWNVIVQS